MKSHLPKYRILISSGPTREYLDSVRCLTNPSSGKMGLALAQAAVRRGHQVIYVAGPDVPLPRAAARVHEVISARDMLRVVGREFSRVDAAIMAAAVADYRPLRQRRSKLKKTRRRLTLELVRNPDILGQLAARKGKRVLIGFALEGTLRAGAGDSALRQARRKLLEKKLDAVICNSPAAVGAERADFWILAGGQKPRHLPKATKLSVARRVIRLVEGFLRERLN